MKKHWFVLGNFPLISTAEILAVLSLKKADSKPTDLDDGLLKIITPKFNASEFIKKVGGTIKIGEEIASGLNEDDLIKKITEILQDKTGKINFGISYYGQEDGYFIKHWARRIKENIKEQSKNARFVYKNEKVLSSVTVDKNNLTEKGAEFLINGTHGDYSIAQTLVVQPFEDFSDRDFGRPNRDGKSGMLPPKLALMLINISQAKKDSVFYDPFCGSGTILTEALLQDFSHLIGSDISLKAIEDTEKNIAWTKEQSRKKSDVKLFQSEVTKISKKIPADSIDTICAEPYLGQPLRGGEPVSLLLQQTEDLKKMYIDAFREIHKIIKKGGTIVFIIPRFKFKDEWLTINCQKEISKLGFTAEPILKINNDEYNYLLYHRANQKVGREIWKFKKM